MDPAEEARLLGLARHGDMCAFGRLVDAHQLAVRAFLRRLVGSYADADDIAQEAFARTWQVLNRYDGRSSLRSFICGVALQYWRRGRRADNRRLARDTAYSELEDSHTEAPQNTPERLALRRAMDEPCCVAPFRSTPGQSISSASAASACPASPVMKNLGYEVTGSDAKDGANIERLRDCGHHASPSATKPRAPRTRASS
jgi:RNA polymerase sigma factor (sigma-70 family)